MTTIISQQNEAGLLAQQIEIRLFSRDILKGNLNNPTYQDQNCLKNYEKRMMGKQLSETTR